MPIGKAARRPEGDDGEGSVVSNVAAVGANEDGFELHVVVENNAQVHGDVAHGVAYGFDAFGKPAPLNKGGENFVAFELEDAARARQEDDRRRGAQGRRGRDARRGAGRQDHLLRRDQVGASVTDARTRGDRARGRPRPRRVGVLEAEALRVRGAGRAQGDRREGRRTASRSRSTSRSSGTHARATSSRSSAAARWFAECTAKYDVGDEVPVYVRHWWDDRGYYRWDIERMGDCWRDDRARLGRLVREGPGVQGRREPRLQGRLHVQPQAVPRAREALPLDGARLTKFFTCATRPDKLGPCASPRSVTLFGLAVLAAPSPSRPPSRPPRSRSRTPGRCSRAPTRSSD